MDDKQYNELLKMIKDNKENNKKDKHAVILSIVMILIPILFLGFVADHNTNYFNTQIQQLSRQVDNLSYVCDSLKSQEFENK